MLQAMRNGMNSWITRSIFSALLLLALGGLVLSDSGGFFREGVNKGTVAEIGSQELSFVQFDRSYRRAIEDFPYKSLLKVPEYRSALAKETLQKEIETRMLSLAAREDGLIISDKIAAKEIREYLKPLTEEGNMFDKTALQYVLRKQGISEAMLVNNIKNRTAVKLLMSAVTTPIRASKQVVHDMYQIKNEKRSAYFTKIKLANFKVETPSDEILKKFYAEQQDRWMTPEYRKISILKITPEAILEKEFGKDAITEKEVKELYDARIAEFSEEDKKKVAIATFKKQEDANKISKYLENHKGKTLKEALKANEDVIAVYLPADIYKRSDILPEELSEPVFSFDKDKGALKPIKSALGWHIAFVEETMKGKVTPFEKVKDKLREELVLEKTSDSLFETVNELEDMFAAGDTAQEAGKFLELPVVELDPISADSKDTEGNKIILDDIEMAGLRYGFSQKLDDYIKAEMHELANGSFIAVSIDKIIPPHKKDFKLVKDEVLKDWKKSEQEKLANSKATEIINKVRNSKAKLADLEKAENITISYMPPQKIVGVFKGDSKNTTPKEFLAKLSELENEGDIISIPDEDGIVVLQLEKIIIPELSAEEKDLTEEQRQELSSIKSSIDEDMKNEISEQYLNAKIAKYGVKINEYSFEKRYGVKAQEEELGQY